MLAIALMLAGVLIATAAAAAWWRRSRRQPAMVRRLDPVRPGVKHLATTVCGLSDGRLHLPAARAALAKSRLGALLDLRHS